MIFGIRVLLLSLLLASCTTKEMVYLDSSCLSFSIIHPSRVDTSETKRQVLVHNQVYRKICGGE